MHIQTLYRGLSTERQHFQNQQQVTNSAQDGHRQPTSDKGQVSATFSSVKQRLQPNICTVAPSNSPTVFSDKPKHSLPLSGRPFLAASFSPLPPSV